MDYLRFESLYVGAIVLSSVCGVVVAAWLQSRNVNEHSIRLFTVLVLLHPVVGILVIGELLAPSRSMAILLYGTHTAGVAAINVVWFFFALAYTGRRRRLSRPVVGAVLGVFLVVATLEVTNVTHRLVWSDYAFVGSPFVYIKGEPTLVFTLFIGGVLLLYLSGLWLLSYHFQFGPSASRLQTASLLVGFLSPVLILPLWNLGVLSGPLNGYFVIGSTFSFSLVAWAVLRHQLFDLMPLARETVFEELDEIVIVTDRTLRLLDYNKSALVAFPVLAGETGTPLGELLSGAVIDNGDENDEESNGDDETDNDSSGLFAPSYTFYQNGSLHEYAVDVSTLRVSGAIRGYALTVRDVTERRQQVRDLRQQTAQLERFAGTLSHDLRNPLTVAQGWIDVTSETGELTHLEKSRTALDRIGQIIQDLLTLTREGRAIDAGELTRIRLVWLLKSAWEMTETKDATLELGPDTDVVVYADETRLRNVFENIVRNALEHGGDDVTVTLGRQSDGFYLEDDGPGIPPAERERVFDYEYTTAETGTGLGLAIVDSIASAHGWSVAVADGSTGGTRIVFSNVDLAPASERERALASPD